MPVFRALFNRTKPASETTEQPAAKPGGKGRPTPTRKEAEAAARARAKAAPPSRRELAMAERSSRLAERDAGPVKRLVRDLVDTRLSLMELMLPILAVVLVLGWIGAAQGSTALIAGSNILLYASFLTVVTEWIMLRFRVRREVAQRFPSEPLGGLTFYAGTRGMQMRFLRRPRPEVRIGQPLAEHYR